MNNETMKKTIGLDSLWLYIGITDALVMLYLSIRGIGSGNVFLFALLFILMLPAILSANKVFYILFFFLVPFNNIIYIGTISIVTIVSFIRVAWIILFGKNRFRFNITILLLLFFVGYSAVLWNSSSLMIAVKHLFLVLLCIDLFTSINKSNDSSAIERIAVSMSLGVISSSAISFVVNGFSVGRFSVTDSSGKNQLGILCGMCVAYLVMLLFQNVKRKTVKIVLIALLVIFGLATISRTFFIMSIITIIWTGLYIIFNSKNTFRSILVAVFASISVYFAFNHIPFLNEMIHNVFFRMDALETDGGGGRFALWQEYLGAVLSSAKTMLFGISNYSNYRFSHVAHNMWVEILAQYGLVGFPIILATFVSGIREIVMSHERIKRRWFSFLPLLLFFASSFFSHSPVGIVNTVYLFLAVYAVYAFSKTRNQYSGTSF